MKEKLTSAEGIVLLQLDLYNELIDAYCRVELLEEELEDARGRLADMQAISKQLEMQISEMNVTIEATNKSVHFWFDEATKYKKLVESNTQEEHKVKPSKDCLTAMAEQSWHDCRRIGGGVEDVE